MTPLRAFHKTVIILAVALAAAVAVCFLPGNPYQRWQLLDGTIHADARWIYERNHFDPTQVDIVFLGPSRIGAAVNAPRLGEALKALGLPSHVVNFSLPEDGRNTNWAVAKEMFADKKPKLVVLGVDEKPSRFGHPAFKYLADPGAIADPGYMGDLNYFSDLVYLPFRQMRLFAANLLPDGLGLAKTFDAAQYRGASIDTTGNIVLPDGRIKNGVDPASQAELTRGVRKLERGARPPILPALLRDVEFGDERHYIREIAALARANGARIVFLHIPYYTGRDAIQEEPFYRQFGDIIDASFLASHAEWYADYGHLTAHGASVLTDWLVPYIARELRDAK
ncbi:MAG TPA: hypothetical protein VMB83_08930 [Roseiarcus sp.]|nr:hypothetical protein [Roseiarcus sp.]